MFKNFGSLIALAGLICVLGATNAAAAGAAKEETLTELFAANLVFVTKGTYTGNLGGLGGADAICRTSATDAGLGGNFRAWLSVFFSGPDDTETPTTRFNVLPLGPYFMLNGDIVADNFADLLDGSINSFITISEDGVFVPFPGSVWTGTRTFGSADSDDCDNWTTDSGAVLGRSGTVDEIDSRWTFNTAAIIDCSTPLRLYCFQQ